MLEVVKKLQSRFSRDHRYSNFGPSLRKLEVSGFRGITASMCFDFPVTAITGLNGAGKSTFGQLALCGYKVASTENEAKRFYVKDFFPVSVADPTPFSDDARVLFEYETDVFDAPKELTVSRAAKEWSGYKRQPERHVEYIGLAFYIPKVERKDLTIYSASSLMMTAREDLDNAGQFVSRILGGNYTDIFFQGVQSKKRHAKLGVAERFGSKYSENNMGFGEGRVIHTIKVLETCPRQSLIVLEEPETSLHESAQFEFSKYLMDVAARRGHQIIFSTHSTAILDPLPYEARKMLSRDQNGVNCYDRISSNEVRTALSDGHSGKVIVGVEDRFAELFLLQILRQYAPNLVPLIKVVQFGDAKAVENAICALKKSAVKCFAVRDGDQPQKLSEDILKLPGALPPEKEVFQSVEVQEFLNHEYNFDLLLLSRIEPKFNHHEYGKKISEKISISEEIVNYLCIQKYVASQKPDWAAELLKEFDARCR